jgi:hypothetical protein
VSDRRVELVKHHVLGEAISDTTVDEQWLQDLKAIHIKHSTERKALYKKLPKAYNHICIHLYEFFSVFPIILLLISLFAGLVPQSGDMIGAVFATVSFINQLILIIVNIALVVVLRNTYVERARSILFWIYQVIALISVLGTFIFSYSAYKQSASIYSTQARIGWDVFNILIYVWSYLYYPHFAHMQRSSVTLVYSLKHSSQVQELEVEKKMAIQIRKLLLGLKDDVTATATSENETLPVGLVQVVTKESKSD